MALRTLRGGASVAPGGQATTPAQDIAQQLNQQPDINAQVDAMVEAKYGPVAPLQAEPEPAIQSPSVVPGDIDQTVIPTDPALGAEITTPEGQPLTQQEKVTLAQEELLRQQQEVEAQQGQYDFDPNKRSQVLEQYQDKADPTVIGTIQNQAANLGIELTKYPSVSDSAVAPAGQTKLDTAQQLLGVGDANSILNASISAVTNIGIGTYAQDKGGDQDTDFEALALDPLGLNQEGEPKADTDFEGGIEVDNFYDIIGNQINERVNPIVTNELGQPVRLDSTRPVTAEDTRLVGELIAPELEKIGLLQKVKTRRFPTDKLPDKDNPIVEKYIAGPQGRELFYAARGLEQARDPSKIKGRAQTVPVGDSGWYSGALALARRGDKKRYGSSKKPEQLASYQRQAGQVGVFPNPNMVALGGALIDIAQDPAHPLHKEAFKIMDMDPGFKNPDRVAELKAQERQKELADVNKILEGGKLVYRPHFNDPSVNRIYDDTIDANFQRSKRHRGWYTSGQRPILTPTKRERVGPAQQIFSDQEIDGFENSLHTSYNKEFSPKQKELNFIWTISRNIHGKPAEDWTINRTIKEVTGGKLQQWAETGAAIQQWIANGSDPQAIPEQLAEVIRKLGKDDWGFVAQSYIDAANYQRGEAFQPSALTEIDMKSAGRAFLAADVGNEVVLQRVGMIWEQHIDPNDPIVTPFGSPRDHFVEMVPSVIKQQTFSKPGEAQQAQELIDAIAQVDPKEFSKAVLLQTDYGKPIGTHQENARDVLNKNPDLEAVIKRNWPDSDPAEILADVYRDVLKKTVNLNQMTAPKLMAQTLGFVGKAPNPVGLFDEMIPFGQETYVEDPNQPAIQFGEQVVKPKIKMLDPTARGTKKEYGGDVYVPAKGSFIANAVGPSMGQYRESAVLAKAVNRVNGPDNNTPDFFVPVFDNFILDSQSGLKYHQAANSAVKEIVKWDIKKNFEKDFQIQYREAIEEMPDIIDLSGDVRYNNFLDHLDNMYYWIQQNRVKDPDAVARNRAFLDQMREAVGWSEPDFRGDDTIQVSKQEYISALGQFIKFSNLPGKAQQWLVDKQAERERMIDKINKQNRLYFVN